MRILRPIVEPLVLAMLDAKPHLRVRSSIGPELVRDQDARQTAAASTVSSRCRRALLRLAGHGGADKPVSLPVPALDHATGISWGGVRSRPRAAPQQGQAISASLSLARTAALLMGTTRQGIEPKALSATNADYSADIEATDWGSAHRALPPVSVAGAPIGWRRPASRSGSAPATWGA